jgi:tetratricopeptide (TPR) repeat protein
MSQNGVHPRHSPLDARRKRYPSFVLGVRGSRLFCNFVVAVATLAGGGCVKRLGRIQDDNFYVVKRSKNESAKRGHESLLGPSPGALSTSITGTLKAQANSSPRDTKSLSNAAILEKENPEISSLLNEARKRPTDAEIHSRLAETYYQLRLYEEAQQHCQRAIQIEPNSPVYYELAARLWRDWGVPDSGINAAQKALQLKANFVEAWNTLGTLYDKTGNRKRAQESFLKALSFNSTLDYVHSNLCYSYLNEEDFVQAIDHGEQAVRLNPSSTIAHNNLGIAYGMHGEFNQALREFQQAGDEATARNNLGLVLLKKGRVNESMEQFRLASRLKPFYRIAAENYYKARTIGFKQERETKRLARERSKQPKMGAPETFEPAELNLPQLSLGGALWDLLNGPLGLVSQEFSPVPSWLGSSEPIVKFAIERPARLTREGKILGEFLQNGRYQLSGVQEIQGGRSKTIVYYQPGYSGAGVGTRPSNSRKPDDPGGDGTR